MELRADRRRRGLDVVRVTETHLGPVGGNRPVDRRAGELAEQNAPRFVEKQVAALQVAVVDALLVDVLDHKGDVPAPLHPLVHCGVAASFVVAAQRTP